MKKIIPLLIVLAILLCACSYFPSTDPDNLKTTYYEDGSYSYQTPGGISYSINSLPFTLENNGAKMDLVDVQYYEVYSQNNHGYTGYVIAVYDRANLTDDAIYWMDKTEYASQEFDVNAFVREKDGSDSSFMKSIWNRYDKDFWYRIFRTNETMRYSLSGGQISVQSVWAANKDDQQNKWYHYSIIIDEKTDYSDLSRLTTKEIEMITRAIADELQ